MRTIISKLIRFLKDWALPVAMITGIVSYLIGSRFCPSDVCVFVDRGVSILQPVLLFFMLFISFCKINPAHIRLCRWHFWLVLIQAGSFLCAAVLTCMSSNENVRILLECFMCCMICPTATAAVVIVDKLGGNKLSLVAYTIFANIVTSILVPLVVPFVNQNAGTTFIQAFLSIIKQVFPLLVCPFLLAWFVRLCIHRLLVLILSVKDLAFYLWIVALALAMGVTAKAVVHTSMPLIYMLGMLFITMFCCFIQFILGKAIASRYYDTISGGQALGQKSTVFMIWMGATFLNPVTALSGGFYSIWHNMVNSYQLYRKRKGLSV